MINIISENYTSGYEVMYLHIISLFSVILGIYIIISKNPILSVLFLIGLFSSISVYLMLLGMNFLGLSYLLVYVGAISILFLFILMLINIRISELLTDNKNSIPLAIFTILFFNYIMYDILPYNISVFDIMNIHSLHVITGLITSLYDTVSSGDTLAILFDYTYNGIATVKSKSWDNILAELTHITSIGNILYTNQFILFILASLVLLLAMVGAINITINKTVSNNRSHD